MTLDCAGLESRVNPRWETRRLWSLWEMLRKHAFQFAWRNDVMHPKAKYDEKEAQEVLASVRAFLDSIVKLV